MVLQEAQCLHMISLYVFAYDARLKLLTYILLKAYFQSDLTLTKSWYINGTHYSRTLEDWLKLQDKHNKGRLVT